jgi:sterol desaturase/sphingolipid hydroxylase (fatty acid hydroxylase superfamily)
MFENFFSAAWHEFTSFWQIGEAYNIIASGHYEKLRTLDGVLSFVKPIIPFLLLFEIIRALFYKRFKVEDYKVPFFILVFNRVAGAYISIAAVSFCIGLFSKYAIIKTSFTWYWLIYGYIAWEFSHFIYHYLAHKVRLFWCLHSSHHAPQNMNLSVSYAHFFLEGPYANVIRTSICILAGLDPPLLFFIMFIDGTWGTFIHIGDNIMKDARLGVFNKFILTPSHHRVHHAKNPLYMDTNFCNLLNIWDKIFGTLQTEERGVPVEYGITRKINHKNFWDVYFGEIVFLARDVRKAPGVKNKFLYIFMPPGWSHTGEHKTAKVIRREALVSLEPPAMSREL